ncbi:hypothetical protein [Nonomuraea sp. CA-218870]|uniref:hypothetical protein n=1 Tax=Nonomuraea sp. CA-218870 TaxID=3239998 RepID=UPI003D9115B8
MYGIELDDPSTLALVVSLYYGGVHLVGLLWGCALLVLAAAMRRAAWGRAVVIVGVVAGPAQLAGSVPWLLGPARVLRSRHPPVDRFCARARRMNQE